MRPAPGPGACDAFRRIADSEYEYRDKVLATVTAVRGTWIRDTTSPQCAGVDDMLNAFTSGCTGHVLEAIVQAVYYHVHAVPHTNYQT